jgi:hypothetical protein
MLRRTRLLFVPALPLTLLFACSGPPGIDGVNGADGQKGDPGLNGLNGLDGQDGQNGLNGDNGQDGQDGRDGVDRVLDPSLAPLDKMFFALGGREAILALTSARIEATGARFVAGEGFTPESEPVAANTYATTTSLDFEGGAARVDTTRQIQFLFPQQQTYAEIVRGELGAVDGIEHAFGFPTGAMSADRAAAFEKQLRLLQPLLLARAIADDETLVTDGGNAFLGRLLFHVLVVEDAVAPLEIYVDAATGEIARVATIENDYLHRDVAVEALYFDWVPSGAPRGPH